MSTKSCIIYKIYYNKLDINSRLSKVIQNMTKADFLLRYKNKVSDNIKQNHILRQKIQQKQKTRIQNTTEKVKTKCKIIL